MNITQQAIERAKKYVAILDENITNKQYEVYLPHHYLLRRDELEALITDTVKMVEEEHNRKINSLRGILWHDDPKEHNRRLIRENTLNEVLQALTQPNQPTKRMTLEQLADFNDVFPDATDEQRAWMAEYGSCLYHNAWNEAIKECEGCVPKKKENGYAPDHFCFNSCREQTLQNIKRLRAMKYCEIHGLLRTELDGWELKCLKCFNDKIKIT